MNTHITIDPTFISEEERLSLKMQIKKCRKSMVQIAAKAEVSYGTVSAINQHGKKISRLTMMKVKTVLLDYANMEHELTPDQLLAKEVTKIHLQMHYHDQVFFYNLMKEYIKLHYPFLSK